MDKQHLDKTVADLHTELARATELDAESRERLTQLLAEIQSVLKDSPSQAPEETKAAEPEEDDSLVGRWNEAVIDFEAAHPQLSQIMGRIADGLSQLGI